MLLQMLITWMGLLTLDQQSEKRQLVSKVRAEGPN